MRPLHPYDAVVSSHFDPRQSAPRAISVARPPVSLSSWLFGAALFWLVATALAAASTARGDEVVSHGDPRLWMIELASEEGSSFTPTTEAALAADAARLGVARAHLDTVLKRWGTTGDGWRTYLKWQAVSAQLDAGSQGDAATLETVVTRLDSGHEGLALDAFKAYGAAMTRYLRTLRAVQLPDQRAAIEARLAVIRGRLSERTSVPTDAALEALGVATGWLEAHGYAAKLVSAVRATYAQPNVYVRMSGDALLAGMEERVDETVPINDTIQGARVTGSGKLSGVVRFRLVPDPQRAAIEMYADATIHSSIRGYRDPAGFSGTGVTRIAATKRVYLDLDGMIETPAQANATTCLRTNCVWTRFRGPLLNRIGTRIAAREIAAGRASSERTVSQRAARQFTVKFEDNAAPMLAEANEALIYAIRVPMAEQGLMPRDVHLSTTSEHLHARMVQANAYQLAAAAPPPEYTGSPAMVLSLHESAINNSANNSLAGHVLESYELSELLALLFGGVPKDWEPDDGDWSLVLAERAPVEIDIDDGCFTIRLRGQQYMDTELASDTPVEIGARYLATHGANGPELVRDGPLWVETAPAPALAATLASTAGSGSSERSALEQAIAARFAPVFVERASLEPIALPMDPDGGKLSARDCRMQSGWLMLTFDK